MDAPASVSELNQAQPASNSTAQPEQASASSASTSTSASTGVSSSATPVPSLLQSTSTAPHSTLPSFNGAQRPTEHQFAVPPPMRPTLPSASLMTPSFFQPPSAGMLSAGFPSITGESAPQTASWLLDFDPNMPFSASLFGSAGLPLSASLLASPQNFFAFTFPEDGGETSQATQLKQQASSLGQQVQSLLTELKDGTKPLDSAQLSKLVAAQQQALQTIPTVQNAPPQLLASLQQQQQQQQQLQLQQLHILQQLQRQQQAQQSSHQHQQQQQSQQTASQPSAQVSHQFPQLSTSDSTAPQQLLQAPPPQQGFSFPALGSPSLAGLSAIPKVEPSLASLSAQAAPWSNSLPFNIGQQQMQQMQQLQQLHQLQQQQFQLQQQQLQSQQQLQANAIQAIHSPSAALEPSLFRQLSPNTLLAAPPPKFKQQRGPAGGLGESGPASEAAASTKAVPDLLHRIFGDSSKLKVTASPSERDDDDDDDDSQSDDDSHSIEASDRNASGSRSTHQRARPNHSKKSADMDGPKKRKRNSNKREPRRDEFKTEAEYNDAWARWREIRDNNNNSVKRSRENSKLKKMDHERLCHEREKENALLEQLVKQLRQEVNFLTKVLKKPHDLDPAEQQLLKALLADPTPPHT